MPFAQRSASKALHTISRGSKLPLPEGNTIRFFIWWKDGKSRTDIDLSAVSLDKDFEYREVIAYYNLRSMGGYHSGDITSAPEGASEFIDIDIPTFLDRGIHYLVMSINSFTSQPYCDLPECFAGFMMRQKRNSGEVYEPKTVVNKFDLTANSRIAMPLIIDLEKREVVWADLSLKQNLSFANNVRSNISGIKAVSKALVQLAKPDLYSLFSMHAQARGVLVNDIAKANTIFALDKGITPYDIDTIVSAYL